VGRDNFDMNPQNQANLNVAPNSAQYNDKSVATFKNRSDRTRLLGSNIADTTQSALSTDSATAPLILQRPTLLGSGT